MLALDARRATMRGAKNKSFAGVCHGGPWGGGCYAYVEPVFKLGPWVSRTKIIVGEYRFENDGWVSFGSSAAREQ
jgi:hypothetical protein